MKKIYLLIFLFFSLTAHSSNETHYGDWSITGDLILPGSTANRVMYLDGSKKAKPSSVTNAELIYVVAFAPVQTGNAGKFLSTDGTNTSWQTVPSSGALTATGTGASPVTITAGGGITPSGVAREVIYVASSSGAVAVTANPKIVAGTTVGQELLLFGTSATDYIILSDGTGISLNGPINLTDNAAITLVWNGTVWSELSRR